MPALIELASLLMPRSAQQIINDSLTFLANPPDPNLVSVRTANWRTGGPYRTLLYRQGIEASLLYQILAGFAGSAFLRYASGRWLDWIGEDYFNEPRQGASNSTVTLQVTIPIGAGPIGPIQVTAATSSGLQYTSTTLQTLPAGPAVVNFTATAAKAGAIYNVGAGTITNLVTPNVLGITVTNPADAQGGFDEEPDQRYAQRLMAKWGVLATGSPASAYAFWALTASKEVQKVRVYSNLGLSAFTARVTRLVVGTNTGAVSVGALSAVYDYVLPRIPLDTVIEVDNVNQVLLNVTGAVRVYGTYLAGSHPKIANSLQQLTVRVPIGGFDTNPVPPSMVEDAVFYDPREVFDVVLTNPTTPVAPGPFDLVVFTDGTTTTAV